MIIVKKNGYKEKSIVKQNRKVFENKYNNDLLARLTTEEENGERITILDFKNVNFHKKGLSIANESKCLEVTEENRDFVESLLNVLEFYKSADNFRTRYVYEKDNIKFEIDDYTVPPMKVVAIEGEEREIKKVYKFLNEHIKE